jgi:hypothetical protein
MLSACLGLFSPMPTSEKAPPVEAAGPVQIDFSPLPGGELKQDYKIYLVVEIKDRPKFDEAYTIGAGTSVVGVRDLVKGSLAEGWKFDAVGDDKLVLRSFKGSPVTNVRISCEGIPSSMWPRAGRAEEKKEKDK